MRLPPSPPQSDLQPFSRVTAPREKGTSDLGGLWPLVLSRHEFQETHRPERGLWRPSSSAGSSAQGMQPPLTPPRDSRPRTGRVVGTDALQLAGAAPSAPTRGVRAAPAGRAKRRPWELPPPGKPRVRESESGAGSPGAAEARATREERERESSSSAASRGSALGLARPARAEDSGSL